MNAFLINKNGFADASQFYHASSIWDICCFLIGMYLLLLHWQKPTPIMI